MYADIYFQKEVIGEHYKEQSMAIMLKDLPEIHAFIKRLNFFSKYENYFCQNYSQADVNKLANEIFENIIGSDSHIDEKLDNLFDKISEDFFNECLDEGLEISAVIYDVEQSEEIVDYLEGAPIYQPVYDRNLYYSYERTNNKRKEWLR